MFGAVTATTTTVVEAIAAAVVSPAHFFSLFLLHHTWKIYPCYIASSSSVCLNKPASSTVIKLEKRHYYPVKHGVSTEWTMEINVQKLHSRGGKTFVVSHWAVWYAISSLLDKLVSAWFKPWKIPPPTNQPTVVNGLARNNSRISLRLHYTVLPN